MAAKSNSMRREGTPLPDTPTRAYALEPGDDPWAQEEQCALYFTGNGAFVVCRDALYAYARPAQREDFVAVFGSTGGDLWRGDRWTGFRLVAPIPHRILHQAWSFLVRAWERYRTEDVLVVQFSLEAKEYSFVHPKLLFANECGVGYEPPAAPVGAVNLGSFHSHPRLPAYHSGSDDHDVQGIPGLHIVLGNVESPLPSLACALSTPRGPLAVHPCDVFGPPAVARGRVPDAWLERPAVLPKSLKTHRHLADLGGKEGAPWHST